MSNEDWWSSWFRRRRWPFFGRSFFEDFEEMIREMEEIMQREFEEISKRTPSDLIRERKLPDGSTIREWGPFVYGYSITIGPDGKPQIREFPFQTNLFESYQRSEKALLLALQQMVIDGISTNKLQKITRKLSDDLNFSKSTVNRLMKELDPMVDEWRKRQIDTLKAVGESNFKTGIASPKKDPIAAGIEAEDRFAAEMKKAIEEKRRKKALEATNIDEWYAYTSTLGAARLVEGVTKREKEVADFVNTWQPILTDHVNKIDAMPAVTDKDMEERMLANLRGLKGLKGKWRGR